MRTGFEKDSPKAAVDKLAKGKVIEILAAVELPAVEGAKDKYLRCEFKGGAGRPMSHELTNVPYLASLAQLLTRNSHMSRLDQQHDRQGQASPRGSRLERHTGS